MKALRRMLAGLLVAGLLTACGGGGGGGNNNAPADPAALSALVLSAGALDQVFQSGQFAYTATVGYLATVTTVTPTVADAGASVTVDGVPAPSGSASDPIPLTVGENPPINIVVTAADGVTMDTYTVTVTRESASEFAQRAYIKASNTDSGDNFGYSVALSGDTLAVGAPFEASDATGINGDQHNNSAANAGAVYVFTRDGGTWTQQAYVKASNTASEDAFGYSVALSGDTLAVGAIGEASDATGINGDQNNNSAANAGAVYVFTRDGVTWTQQAYVKASNTASEDAFGYSVALSGDTLAVGAIGEASDATGINGDQNNNSAANAGAAYVFTRDGVTWTQQAYVKASNTDPRDKFGYSVGLDGDTLAVGAIGEASGATGVNGDQNNNSVANAGAAYVFTRDDVTWSQQAYVKASNTESGDNFGYSVALSGDMLALGAPGRNTNTGAGYLFARSSGAWSQFADFTAAYPVTGDYFGWSLALSADTLAAGARGENSAAVGIDGDQTNISLNQAGAVFTFQ